MCRAESLTIFENSSCRSSRRRARIREVVEQEIQRTCWARYLHRVKKTLRFAYLSGRQLNNVLGGEEVYPRKKHSGNGKRRSRNPRRHFLEPPNHTHHRPGYAPKCEFCQLSPAVDTSRLTYVLQNAAKEKTNYCSAAGIYLAAAVDEG